MEIVKRTSTANTSVYYNRPIQYIVIHYTAGSTSRPGTALNVANMFSNPKQGSSADFIVDDTTIVQFNPDIENRYCWHAGGTITWNKGAKFNGIAKNSNSIGIEVCSTNPNWKPTDMPNTNKWSFTPAVIDTTIELVKYLMKKYNIDVNHIVRHYDCTGKLCPGLIGWNEDSGDNSAWINFKNRLVSPVVATPTTTVEEDEDMTQERFNELMDNYIATLADKPATWEEAALLWAQNKGIMKGDEKGRLMPKKFITRGEAATMMQRLEQALGK